jgi:hypothetical protein
MTPRTESWSRTDDHSLTDGRPAMSEEEFAEEAGYFKV